MLTACGERPMKKVKMTCGEFDVRVAVYKDKIDTVINGQHIPMTQSVVASGAKYMGLSGDVLLTLWNKGRGWIMLINDDRLIECVIPPR